MKHTRISFIYVVRVCFMGSGFNFYKIQQSSYIKVCQKQTLTFQCLGWYLNFSKLLLKNVSHEQKKIKLQNKWHFVGNKTEIMLRVLKILGCLNI